MNTNALVQPQTNTNIIPFSPPQNAPVILSTSTKRKIKRRGLSAQIADLPTNHAADAFTDRADINAVICDCINKKQYYKTAMFIVGINTGYRCGDLVSLRVCDVVGENNNIVSELYVHEQKTGKVRTVYLNEAAKTALSWIISLKKLQHNNYLFRGDGNRKAYLDSFEYNEDGEIINVKTTGERYDENGIERELAPLRVDSVGRWLKTVAQVLHIEGHYSSHAMRKTFAEFIGFDWNDNRNAIAVSAALGHSDVRTTVSYYMGIDPQKLKQKWLTLNLGLEPLKRFIGTNV